MSKNLGNGFTKPIKIVLFGRSNVGKSSLYNSLTRATSSKHDPWARVTKKARVMDVAGTTRDRKKGLARIGSMLLEVTDTGGVEDGDIIIS